MVTTRVTLSERLPLAHRDCERCLDRMVATMRGLRGVLDIQLETDRDGATVIYDPAATDLDEIEAAAQAEGQRIGDVYIHRAIPIEGMDCADCALRVESGVRRLEGVEAVSVNFIGARMDVEYRDDMVDQQAIARRVSELGYRVAETGTPRIADASIRSFLASPSLRPTLAGVLLTLIGLVALIAGAPELLPTALFAGTTLVAGLPIARKGITGLRINRQLDINFLMTIAIVGAALLGEWLEAATVVVLFSIGEALEGFAMDRARRSIRGLMSLTPSEATVRRGGIEALLAVDEIIPGDTVIIRPGGRLPVDGVIQRGMSLLDQAPVTGESVPVERGPGEQVFSGTINGSGVIEIEATHPASDSTIARIVHMVEEAQASKAPAQRFVDVFARYYTPAVVAGAALIALAPPLALGASWGEWFYRALVLLVIACPCALVISTPVSIVSAIAAAARDGVLIKGGAYLEALGSLRAMAFDKTGTLTKGVPAVQSVIALDGHDERRVLELAAAAERYSEHPLGEAIVRAAETRGIAPSSTQVESTNTQTGLGIAALVDGRNIQVGSRRLIANGAVLPEIDEKMIALERQGQTAVLVAIDGQPAGIIGLADELRPEAADALDAIHAAGIRETVMLTGDRREVAQVIAAQAGIDSVEAELLPDQKVDAIAGLLARHDRVAMVGDGVNDAPALARSTVGIAMGAAGAATALETADVALMSDDLGKLAGAVKLSRRARAVIIQNIALALGIKLLVLLLAIGGLATLWQAIFADVGASLVVILNGLRLLRQR